jgi:hypothetical protein
VTTDLTVLYGAVERVDCGVTALGSLMMELDEAEVEVQAIRWLYGVLREEVHNVRQAAELLDTTINGQPRAAPSDGAEDAEP